MQNHMLNTLLLGAGSLTVCIVIPFVQTSFYLQWVEIVDFIFCSCINHKTICEIEKMMVEIYNCSLLGKKLSPVLRNLSLFFVCYTITLLQYLFVILVSMIVIFTITFVCYQVILYVIFWFILFKISTCVVIALCLLLFEWQSGWLRKKSQILVSLP